MKKKILSVIMMLCFAVSLCACGAAKEGNDTDEKTEIIVFAAASMTETLTTLGDAYMAENEDVEILYNFDSSGTLKTQIEEGADVDLFISAGQLQMDQLEELDFVEEGTRFDLLENMVVLAVNEDNSAGIDSFDRFCEKMKDQSILMAMGNEDVPVGQYTKKIFEYYGLKEEELAKAGCITYGTNVKEVTSQISESTVDCGVVYQTDAYSASLKIVDTATSEMCGQVIYPAAVMKVSKNKEAAKQFLDYLTSEKANEVFEGVGFTPVK